MTAAERSVEAPLMLDARSFSKRFGSVLVLDDVSLAVRAGEIRGLLGANGSGKSTFIKVLAGFHQPEGRSELTVAGRRVTFPMAPDTPRNVGLSFVHQDLALIGSLSIADNLALNGVRYEECPNPYRRRPRAERAAVRRLLARYGIDIDPWTPVDELSRVDRALVAIVRAVVGLQAHAGAGILVLDEPTASLPESSKERVAALVREVTAQGCAVIFVSHDLEEVIALCDSVSVLRDGRLQATEAIADVDVPRLVELIVGSALPDAARDAVHVEHAARAQSDVALRLRDARGGAVRRIDLALQPGEIVGAAGLVGAGHDALPYLAFGAVAGANGTIECGSRTFALRDFTPARAVLTGIALIPGNRQDDAIVASMAVADNVLLPVLDAHVRRGLLLESRLESAAKRLLQEFDIRPSDPLRLIGQLSGGNQQRAVLAKWINSGARVILMHDPTQGVDVRARDYIHALVRSMAREGLSFLIASSDQEELAALCDRVLVMRRGAFARELPKRGLTKERLIEACLQTSA